MIRKHISKPKFKNKNTLRKNNYVVSKVAKLNRLKKIKRF